VHGKHGVVLMTHRRAEQREEGVACVLVDVSTEPPHLVRAGSDYAVPGEAVSQASTSASCHPWSACPSTTRTSPAPQLAHDTRSEASWAATPDPLTVVESGCPQRGHGDCAGESDMSLMTISLLGTRTACRRHRSLQLADVSLDRLAGGFDLS